MSGDVVLGVAALVALVTAGVFAMAETALTRMTRAKVRALVDSEVPGADRLAEIVSDPERFLNPLLFTVLVSQLVQATMTGVLAGRLFGLWGIVIATVLNVIIVFVVAEAAPKTWAIQHPERAALISARLVVIFVGLWPVRIVSRALIGLTNVILPGKGLRSGPYVSERELLALAEVAAAEDVIEDEERELIEQVIEFGDTVVREVMVPRPDMVAISDDFRVVDAMEVVLLNGFSRMPVYSDDVDDVTGIIYTKDLMRAERDGRADEPVRVLARPATYVPETKRVAALLPEMQTEQFHMAIVIDEYGGTAGLVTLEDLIEEIVGEIVDEFDREEPTAEPLADGSVRVNARMPVDEVVEWSGAELPEGDWDTIGGLVLHLLGHIPVTGESVACGDRTLTVDRVQGRRIGAVRISPAPHRHDREGS